MEAFSCDQVSINPFTFTTCFIAVRPSVSDGHIVVIMQKRKEMCV